MDPEIKQAALSSWAIVDVLGHQRYIGYVTTEAYGQAVLFRVDVPALDARERVTKSSEYAADGTYVPPGSTVQEGPVAGYTKLIGSGSIYSITPCTQEAALKAVEATQRRPLMHVTLAPDRALAVVAVVDDDDDDDDRNDDREDYDLDPEEDNRP